MIQGILYNKSSHIYEIRELEVSLTSSCHLCCDNCGFNVPFQPNPSQADDVVSEITYGLSRLQRLNVNIRSLAILGGEPSYNKRNLEKAIKQFSQFENIRQVEVVTHGLTPQNITMATLKLLNKLSISVYFEDEELIFLWKSYLAKFAPHIELSLRINKKWDQWIGEETANDSKAQKMFSNCWYRKHAVTFERQRLFLCPRIAKLEHEHNGLFLDDQTDLYDIKNYLNQLDFLSSCKTCIPMMGFSKINGGQQPDDRIDKMIPKAINFLADKLDERT